MGFLQRSALNVAVILPVVGIAGCISYIIAIHFHGSEPAAYLPVVTNAASPAADNMTDVVGAKRVRPPNETAAEAIVSALSLRNAMAGPLPEASFSIPVPKPRPKNLSSHSGSR
jgi:hypothetical protein